ncbi:MAG: hypothetical protein KC646_13660 [Candidatus Cloacimonetes bacterium]|nr:hypothetical protein [Candidatus Cloacimonadota bacterium]
MSPKLQDLISLAIKALIISFTLSFLHDSYRLEQDFPIEQYKRCLLNQKALLRFLDEDKSYSSSQMIQSKRDLQNAKNVDLFPKLIEAHPFYIGENVYRSYKKKAWCDYHGEVASIHLKLKQFQLSVDQDKKLRLYVLIVLDCLILLGLLYVFRTTHHSLRTNLEIGLWFILYLLLSYFCIDHYLNYLVMICMVGLATILSPMIFYYSKTNSA